eukprot:365043-Chlamydomonas_euryale.AAC.11
MPLPSSSISLIMSCNSASVGFCPSDLITVPSSRVVMAPLPSLSNFGKRRRGKGRERRASVAAGLGLLRHSVVLCVEQPKRQAQDVPTHAHTEAQAARGWHTQRRGGSPRRARVGGLRAGGWVRRWVRSQTRAAGSPGRTPPGTPPPGPH